MKRNNLIFGKVLFVLGLLLVACAFVYLLHNINEERNAGIVSQKTADIMFQQMADDSAEISEDNTGEQTFIDIDGKKYVGILTIPKLSLELPVMKELSSAGLKSAPCRYCGSIINDNMVIAAHNYQTHFGNMNKLVIDDEIYFTEVNGKVIRYRVAEKETLKPYEIERMTESDYDLTLFTCTIGGRLRVTVRCERADI